MRSLNTILSIARALASTPAPVYGMPAISRKPWSVPSSPNGPWSARKAMSIASASDPRAWRESSADSGNPPAAGIGRPPPARKRATCAVGVSVPTSEASEPSSRAGAGAAGRCQRPSRSM